jgi:hypothetical protein
MGIERYLCVALLGGVLLPGAAAHAAPAQRIEFEVRLDARPLGTHRFIVTGDPATAATVESEARFDVRILGFNAYSYRHRASERWATGCLVALEADTNDDGRKQRVVGALKDGRFQLEQPAALAQRGAAPPAPECVMGYVYWDRDRLLRQRVLLNPQTGMLDAVSFESLGTAPLAIQGGTIMAEHYRLHPTGRPSIDLWYTPEGDWLQLESTVERRRLVYQLTSSAGLVTAAAGR